MDGVIYTVSLQNPNVGNTGWRLVSVDPEDASVRIAKIGESGTKSKASSPSAYTIGFSRKDPADDKHRGQPPLPGTFGAELPPAGLAPR